ncbi:MAG: type II toxin-antitoxin system RelE/ParE family toxin [Oscillibacter sp.]|nr:type II toxin-antitoxin system RelE/ParE family toxin [Oscillibacter sp.]
MKILYKKTAIEDIRETERYISKELHNKQAAQKLTRMIVQSVSLLSTHPYMGTPLSSIYDVETDIRFLVVSKHLVFYRVREEQAIEITRVIDGRQDYLALLFS